MAAVTVTPDQARHRTKHRATPSSEFFLEKIHRALPGQLCCRDVVTRCRVVVGAVLRTRVAVHRVFHTGRFQGCLVGWPAGIDALVRLGVLHQQRCLDPCRFFGTRLTTVERQAAPRSAIFVAGKLATPPP